MALILYEADIRCMEGQTEKLIKFLSPERRTKMYRYRNHTDQLRSLTAGLLLYRALGERSASVCYNDFGKPYLEGGPFFNLSHSGNRVVLLTHSSAPVGCDIQQHENTDPHLIAKHLFHPVEYEYWQSLPAEEKLQGFYLLWTLKESYLKMIGKGFSVAPKRIHFQLTPSIRLLETSEEGPFFFMTQNDEFHTLTLCSQTGPTSIIRETVDSSCFL